MEINVGDWVRFKKNSHYTLSLYGLEHGKAYTVEKIINDQRIVIKEEIGDEKEFGFMGRVFEKVDEIETLLCKKMEQVK